MNTNNTNTVKSLFELRKTELDLPNMGKVTVRELTSDEMQRMPKENSLEYMVSKALVQPKASITELKNAPSKFINDFSLIVAEVTGEDIDPEEDNEGLPSGSVSE